MELSDLHALAALLACACENGWLDRSQFEVPNMPNLIDTLPGPRNHIGHGNMHILPQLSVEMLRLCIEILNEVFEPKP